MIGVVGAGSIGLRHIKNLITLGQRPMVYDISPAAREAAVAVGAQFWNPDTQFAGMVIASPAIAHSGAATFGRGLPLFVEKPLGISREDVKAFAGANVQVGFNLRFVPAVAELRRNIENQRVIFARVHFSSDLREWRRGDYRQSVSAQKSLGGGILNEAQHELDLIRHLFGEWSWVQGWTTNSGRLEVDVEDVAVALIGLIDGGVVELHLDMVRPGYRRGVEVLTDKGDYSIDLHWYGEADLNRMYLAEMAAFLQAIDGDIDPRSATLADGIAAVELSDAIKESSRTGERVFNGAEVEGSLYPFYSFWR